VVDDSQKLYAPTISVTHNILSITDHPGNNGKTEKYHINVNGILRYTIADYGPIVFDLAQLDLPVGKHQISVYSDSTNYLISDRSNIQTYVADEELVNSVMYYFTNENEYVYNISQVHLSNSTLIWKDGGASYQSSGDTQHWLQKSNGNGFADGSQFKYVKIRYRIDPSTTEDGHAPWASLFWRTANVAGDNVVDPIVDGEHTLIDYGSRNKVALIADGEWHELVYDLSSHEKWDNGNIILIRWQFSRPIDGEIFIDHFGLSDKK
jgi:hypothetical protein